MAVIKPLFDASKIRDNLQRVQSRIESAIILALQIRGEEFVSDCRNQQTWQDQTGNLRSSIGYFIYKGSLLMFGDVQGSLEGQNAAESVARQISKKDGVFYLIGVAGMNYAADVESRGYNVISNQSIAAIDLLNGDLQQLKEKFSKKYGL